MADLNDLAVFAAVAANGGFSAAARALGRPKSLVSRRVAALEARLGVRLVERTSRRFALTEVGGEILAHARAALSEAEAVDEVAARQKAEPQGLVRFSCPQGADRLVAGRLAGFLAAHPKLRVQMLAGSRRVDLIGEGVDVAVRVRQRLDSDADLQVKIIGRDTSWLAASPALLAAHGRPQRPENLAALPTLSATERPGLDHWTLVGPQRVETSVAHEPRLSTHDFAVLRQAAIDGAGVAFLPQYVLREPLETGALERVLPAWSGPEAIIHLVFTSRRGLLPGVRAVIDFLAETLDPDSPCWRAIG